MRLGVQASYFSWPGAPASIGPTLGRIARNAEDAGLAALAFAAGQTSRIELGTLVTGVTYRHPGLLVKTVTSLDVLSGGRAWLGIGAAW